MAEPTHPALSTGEFDPMTLAKTPRQREFVAFLQSLEHMLEDELDEAIALCPIIVQDRLARGPARPRFTCGVCEAFGRDFYSGTPDASDPMWRAWGYHEVPKLMMRRRDDQHYGEHANAVYGRTIRTYRAAGWTGEAGEANA